MGFLVSVDGGRAPRFVHETAEQAITEAIRLQNTSVGNGQRVRILSEVFVLESNTKRQGNVEPIKDRFRVIDKSVKLSLGFIFDTFKIYF